LLAAGRCCGPCTGTVDRETYAALAGKVTRFLAGERQVALDELQRRAREASASGNRQAAERLAGLLRTLTARWSGDLLAPPFDPANVAILLPVDRPSRAYVVQHGALRWAAPLVSLGDSAVELLPAEKAARLGPVAMRWLLSNRGQARTIPIPADAAPEEIVDLVEATVRRPTDGQTV
jgi:hypothetical protein